MLVAVVIDPRQSSTQKTVWILNQGVSVATVLVLDAQLNLRQFQGPGVGALYRGQLRKRVCSVFDIVC